MSVLKRTTSYRLYVYTRCLSRSRHTATATCTRDKSDAESQDEEARIPLVPKRKDPNAVLKALQSTVSNVRQPMWFDGRSLADPLSPFSGRLQQMEYVRAKEAGRDAARHILSRWPTMFPHLKASPNKVVKLREKGQLTSPEERLRWLVSKRRVRMSMMLYDQLKEQGTEVSLEAVNELLALLAHEGLGNSKGLQRDESQLIINWPPSGLAGIPKSTPTMEETSEAELEALKDAERLQEELQPSKSKKKYIIPHSAEDDASDDKTMDEVTIWSSDNAAEKLFAEMGTKDSASYDAMIQGLVKHKNYCRAFDLFAELREQNLQASLGTYNALLGALLDSGDSMALQRAMLLAKELNSEPVVQPNITTMNHLLGLSLKTRFATKKLALQIVGEISYLGLEPTLTTLRRLLKAFTLNGEGQVLYKIVDYIEQHPHVLQPTSDDDLSFFLEAGFIARSLSDAALSTKIKRLAEKDQYFLVDNLNYFLSHYLVTIASHGDIQQLKEECPILIPNIFRPYEWVYGMMFKACEEAQDPGFGLWLWKHMRKYQVPIYNTATILRFCGAISSRINPRDAPSYIVALQQAWYQVEKMNIRPPDYLISQTIRLYALNDDLESAWNYLGYFKEYDYRPTFLALTYLLKAHYARGDTDKIIEIMEMMIEQKQALPLKYIRKICETSDIDRDTMQRLVQGFERNLKSSKLSLKTEGPRTKY